VRRFNAVVLMVQRQLEQTALHQTYTNVPHAQVVTPRWAISVRKTHVYAMMALQLQEQTVLQWTKPNVSLAPVATRWLPVILARSTNACVPTALQRLEMSVLQMVLPRAPRVTLAIFWSGACVRKISALAPMALRQQAQSAPQKEHPNAHLATAATIL